MKNLNGSFTIASALFVLNASPVLATQTTAWSCVAQCVAIHTQSQVVQPLGTVSAIDEEQEYAWQSMEDQCQNSAPYSYYGQYVTVLASRMHILSSSNTQTSTHYSRYYPYHYRWIDTQSNIHYGFNTALPSDKEVCTKKQISSGELVPYYNGTKPVNG
jgi:hypothetical protein